MFNGKLLLDWNLAMAETFVGWRTVFAVEGHLNNVAW